MNARNSLFVLATLLIAVFSDTISPKVLAVDIKARPYRVPVETVPTDSSGSVVLRATNDVESVAIPDNAPFAAPTAINDSEPLGEPWSEWLLTVGLVVLVGFIAAFGLPVATYFAYAYNDLAKRWERLRGLHADVVSARIRRKGVSSTISRHLTRATRHERQVTNAGARRGGRGRGLISDNVNGWPTSQAIGTSNQGMTTDIQSLDFENQRYLELHREAEQYNALIRSIPRCLVAKACGFRPWRFQSPKGVGNRQSS